MLISFREAAELSFQIVLSVSVVVGGMAFASVTAKSSQKESHPLNVSRPVLWTSAPVIVDRHDNFFTISVKSASTANAADDICSNAIGLRVTCELIVPSHKAG